MAADPVSDRLAQKKRLLVVAVDALGWRTQLASLDNVVKNRDDVELDVMKYLSPRPLRILLKDIYPAPWHRRLSLVSQAQMARYVLRRDLDRKVAAGRFDAALFLGHFCAAAALDGTFTLPFSAYADVTIPMAKRRFGARGFSSGDIELERRIFAKARHVFGSGDTVARSVVEDHRIEPGKVSACPPLVRFDALLGPAPERSTPSIPGQARIGFIGNDFRRKGGDLLLAAFRQVGAPSSLEMITRAEFHAPGEASVSFRSNVPHAELMNDFLPALDIFCLPSREDLSPLVLIEAAAAGLPVVATDVGAINDIVIDGETGLLVPPNRPDALAAALRRLVDDPELRLRLGAAARRRATQLYDVTRNANALLDKVLAIA